MGRGGQKAATEWTWSRACAALLSCSPTQKPPSFGRCFIKSSTFTGVLFAFFPFSFPRFFSNFAFVRAWVGRSACSPLFFVSFFRRQLAARRHGGGSLAVVAFRFRGVRAALGRRVDLHAYEKKKKKGKNLMGRSLRARSLICLPAWLAGGRAFDSLAFAGTRWLSVRASARLLLFW